MAPSPVWESGLTVLFILISSNRRANLFPAACSDSVSSAEIRALAPRARASSAFSWIQRIASAASTTEGSAQSKSFEYGPI